MMMPIIARKNSGPPDRRYAAIAGWVDWAASHNFACKRGKVFMMVVFIYANAMMKLIVRIVRRAHGMAGVVNRLSDRTCLMHAAVMV